MPLEYGIYFNLNEDEYRAEPCLSASSMKTLLVSPKDFWDQSWMNPDRPVQEMKQHLEFGKAVHSYILEPETFGKYAKEFVAPEGCLKTTDDIKAFLNSSAVKFKSSLKKQELIDTALEFDPAAPIYENVQKKYYDDNPGKLFLPADDYDKLGVMKKCLDVEVEFMDYFKHGVPEVSIIFPCPVTGIKMKARLDYLAAHISDLKTFSKKSKKPIDAIVRDAFMYERYDIQFYVYSMARRIIFEGLKQKKWKAYGDHNPEWLQYIVENYNDNFYFGYIESSRPYNVRILDVEQWRKQDEEHNMLYQKAEFSYEEAVNKFVYCMNTFGPNTPWREENIVISMGDKNLPLHFLESK